MKQEDKDLLLKDLCGRLPYGVKVQVFNYGIETVETLYEIDLDGYITTIEGDELKYSYKPYLLPLSSMTEAQKKELQALIIQNAFGTSYTTFTPQDFYCKYNLDYRGLIPLGLAIDATGKNIY